MNIGVVKETSGNERRVAIVPDTVQRLKPKKFEFFVQAQAGEYSFFSDAQYQAAGATLLPTAQDVCAKADVLVTIHKPEPSFIHAMKESSALIGLLYPLQNVSFIQDLAGRKITAIALDMIPRISLAQGMDILSSQANLSGYWAVVAAAMHLPKIFPMLMTAAGTITPARVLVMGVGVAGLQAIATARRLGAVVEATDVRPECKEQVESLGGKFLQVTGVEVKAGGGGYAAEQTEEYQKKQAELIAEHISKADVVITTALIPGRRAPILVTEAQIKSMRPGSVIVDLAAEQGGNVEGCEPANEVVKHGVTIIGVANTPSRVAVHASQMFSRNVEKLLTHLSREGALKINMEDEITRGCVITHGGEVVHPKVKDAIVGGAV